MQNQPKTLAVLLIEGQAICFVRDRDSSWEGARLRGERAYPMSNEFKLDAVLTELSERIHVTGQLASFTLHLLYDHAALTWLADAPRDLTALQCTHWQILQWEPFQARAQQLNGAAPASEDPLFDWVQSSVLPLLDAAFSTLEDGPVTRESGAQQEHADLLARLHADRAALEAEIVTQRHQLAALQRPAVDDVLSYLPALYRNAFGSIAPHDLALLAGSLKAPDIPSPWPEPAPDTLKALQSSLRRLPETRARQLRAFCRQLPHKLEVRMEMRAWLGDD
jgi:hypothetical protein